ncbi:MAG: hypothetical protein ACOC1G_08635 [Phycisphaeraceae bacterium]
MSRRRDPRGFALLMVLVLVMVAGVALAGLANRSLNRGVQAASDVEAVQRRWAVTSARATLLDRTDVLIREAEHRDPETRSQRENGASQGDQADAPSVVYHQPMRRIELRTELAGHRYHVVITDEQAKANVNTMVAQHDRGGAQMRLDDLLRQRVGPAFSQDIGVRLRTHRHDRSGESENPYTDLVSYDQIFARQAPDRLLLPDDPRRGLTDAVTCWGNGRLHFRRTPDDILDAVCNGPLPRSTVRALLDAREQQPTRSLDETLKSIASFDEDERQRIRQWITDASSTYGLWIVADNGQRKRRYLAVTRTGIAASATAEAPAREVREAPENRNGRETPASVEGSRGPQGDADAQGDGGTDNTAGPEGAAAAVSVEAVGALESTEPQSDTIPERAFFAWE